MAYYPEKSAVQTLGPTNGSLPGRAVEMPRVQSEMNELRDAVSTLDDHLRKLFSHLGPVLTPVAERGGATTACPPDAPTSDVAAVIREMHRRVRGLAAEVADTTQRLEV